MLQPQEFLEALQLLHSYSQTLHHVQKLPMNKQLKVGWAFPSHSILATRRQQVEGQKNANLWLP